jgi:hypothetical protein
VERDQKMEDISRKYYLYDILIIIIS